MKSKLIFIIAFALIFTNSKSIAQCSENEIINLRKIAIVFGEKDYKLGPLKNPLNDAKDMSDSLKKLGFDVYTYYNTDYKTMKGAIDNWYDKISKYDVALFYYSGHGAEVKGKNYLFPIDAVIRGESDLEYVAHSANQVLATMENSNPKFNIMILDACRDNPFTKSLTRDIRSGLATMSGKGSFVGFAASPGTVAQDGDRRNGIYTEAILQYISMPNLTIDQLFTKVNSYVRGRTKEDQVPYKNSSLSSDFCFNFYVDRPLPKNMIPIQPPSEILLSERDNKVFTSDSLSNGISVRNLRTLNYISTLEYNKVYPYKMLTKEGESIYIIDSLQKSLVIIDTKNLKIKNTIKLQNKPSSLAVTKDEDKVYISYKQSGSVGKISIIGTSQGKILKEIALNGNIESLLLPHNSKYLYANTECNNNKKILYAIDIKTDKVVKMIEGNSCGEAIGSLPNNSKLYVSSIDSDGISQINVLNTASLKVVKTINEKSRNFSFTPDGKYLFSLGMRDVSVIRTEDDTVVNKLPFATTPQGIAVSSENKVFVWLPKEQRAKVFSINECIQNTNPVDPETLLKNFQAEQKKLAKFSNGYTIDDFFTKVKDMHDAVVYNVGVDLGNSYTYIQTGVNYDYKASTFSNNYGIVYKLDNAKRIVPLFQATFTDNFIIVVMKDNGTEEIFKTPVNNIDWKGLQKFTREFYIKRVSNLK